MINLAGFLHASQSLQRLPIVKKTLRIVRSPFRILSQFAPRVLVLARRNVQRAQLPQNLALAVPLILIHHRLKMPERIVEPSLLACNAAQLEMRVGLRRIDRHGVLESLDGR